MTSDWQPPAFDPLCTLCVRRIQPHDHPDGLRPVWPCTYCMDGLHERCDVMAWCSCGCGLRDDGVSGAVPRTPNAAQ